jgi:DNA-binding transcriptional ArsR family regulator
MLAQGPRPVHELAAGLPISRPAVSWHLRLLKDAGMVVDRPAGNERIYQLHAQESGCCGPMLMRCGARRSPGSGCWLAAYRHGTGQECFAWPVPQGFPVLVINTRRGRNNR